MNNIDKINKYINDNNITNLVNREEIQVTFIINRVPVNYVRERSGRGHHFYNPKEDKMKEYRHDCLMQLDEKTYNDIQNIISTNNKNYAVSISAIYYYPIPKRR